MNSENIFSGNQGTIVRVFIERGNSASKEYFFKDTFRIGRDNNCAVKINDGLVSRDHIEVTLKKGKWSASDLFSSNGTYLNGIRIDCIIFSEPIKLELGKNGPLVILELIPESDVKYGINPETQGSLTNYIKRYFNAEAGSPNVGEHTRMIRQAFQAVKKKESKKYIKIIFIAVIVAVITAGYSIYQQIKAYEQKELAESIFYRMKEIEIQLSKLSANSETVNIFAKMQDEYEKMVSEMDIYDTNEEDKLILKIARIFGECEINIPENFVGEVKKYIKYWQSTDKLENAIKREEAGGYASIITTALYVNHLPPQFFYLALQESLFRHDAVGPNTRYGYAKGIWQFISQTARKYGLKTGPMFLQNSYDPLDERFDFKKATDAAAKYIRDIYNTRAQASGLLVMGSYNWGEHNIIHLIDSLPEDPKQRNFWNVLLKHRDQIPDETYNYVFYIFSAAVIGENPRLFGFNFDNPLQEAIKQVNK